MSPSRLRVTVQLIDVINDRHVWAENYDRPTGDLFDLQDEISQAITGVLVPALSIAERERYQREKRPSLDAWSSYQKGLAVCLVYSFCLMNNRRIIFHATSFDNRLQL